MSTKSVSLDEEHIKFLDEHPEVNLSALTRQALEKRMEIQALLDEASVEGVMRQMNGEIQFQAISGEVSANRNGDIPVEVEITPVSGGEQ